MTFPECQKRYARRSLRILFGAFCVPDVSVISGLVGTGAVSTTPPSICPSPDLFCSPVLSTFASSNNAAMAAWGSCVHAFKSDTCNAPCARFLYCTLPSAGLPLHLLSSRSPIPRGRIYLVHVLSPSPIFEPRLPFIASLSPILHCH